MVLGVERERRSIPFFDRSRDAGSPMRVVPERVGAAATALLANDLAAGSEWIDMSAGTTVGPGGIEPPTDGL
jgi:hypothetical protein